MFEKDAHPGRRGGIPYRLEDALPFVKPSLQSKCTRDLRLQFRVVARRPEPRF